MAMTDAKKTLLDLIEQEADVDLVREMLAFAADWSARSTNAFLSRPIEGEWPYLWIDATYLQERDGGRIVSTATIVAVGVNTDGRREVLGIATGPSEAEVFWKGFLRSLSDRGLRGVKLVVADDHKGLRATASKVFAAIHQRCRVHWFRNALAHVGPKQRLAVIAMLKTIFAQETQDEARRQWRDMADALREKYPRLADMMDGSGDEVLAYVAFPRVHWSQIASTNPIERLDREFKRRADVVGVRREIDSLDRFLSTSLPTTRPSCGSSAPSCSRPTTSGPSRDAT